MRRCLPDFESALKETREIIRKPIRGAALLLCSVAFAAIYAEAEEPSRNGIIFVADGLRPGSVTPETAPTIFSLAKNGVSFTNTHSAFPTITTANASVIATGHQIADT